MDLERHQAIDLLPGREAAPLAAWLQQHPGVEIVSRDRSQAYAEGAREGAPKAVQVADRFHLIKNLGEALERFFSHHQPTIKRAAGELQAGRTVTGVEGLAAALPEGAAKSSRTNGQQRMPVVSLQAQARSAVRERRMARYQEVIRLRQEGRSQRGIATQLKMSPQTVRRYLAAGAYPETAAHRPRPALLDQYRTEVERRWKAGCHDTTAIWRGLREEGFKGGVDTVRRFVAGLKKQLPTDLRERLQQHTTGRQPQASGSAPPLSARQVVWLFLSPVEKLGAEERQLLDQLFTASAEMAAAYAVGQSFARMLRERRGEKFPQWLQQALKCPVSELRNFAAGLQRDYGAVEAGLTLPWSNGQTEGQVRRLKMIKHQMNGRANFDLLRLRVLHNE